MESCTPKSTVVAVYESRAGAEVAFNALRFAGLDVHPLTILGTAFSSEEQTPHFTDTGIPAKKAVTYERSRISCAIVLVPAGSGSK